MEMRMEKSSIGNGDTNSTREWEEKKKKIKNLLPQTSTFSPSAKNGIWQCAHSLRLAQHSMARAHWQFVYLQNVKCNMASS